MNNPNFKFKARRMPYNQFKPYDPISDAKKVFNAFKKELKLFALITPRGTKFTYKVCPQNGVNDIYLHKCLIEPTEVFWQKRCTNFEDRIYSSITQKYTNHFFYFVYKEAGIDMSNPNFIHVNK